jgi:hypothetical protein
MRKQVQDVRQVCINGHQITARLRSSPENGSQFCELCGARTISTCESCGKDIPGQSTKPGMLGFGSVKVPSNCRSCGTPFPWTKDQKQSVLNTALKSEPNKEEQIALIKNICRKFHLFARQIQNRYKKRNTIEFKDEYDVQDAFHAILKLHFKDVRSEECTPSYAGGSSRMDFLLHDEEISIEIKKTREGLKDKELGEQLIIDKERYKSHPKCKTLICFIYDPEHKIVNPTAIEKDLTQQDGEPQIFAFISPNDH